MPKQSLVLKVKRLPNPKLDFVQKGHPVTVDELGRTNEKWWLGRRCEVKFDGIRAVFTRGQFISYNNKPLYNLESLSQHLKRIGPYVLDGELFQNSWEETMSVVKSSKTKVQPKGMHFMVFDCLTRHEFMYGVCNTPLQMRLARLGRLKIFQDPEYFYCPKRLANGTGIVRMPTLPVQSFYLLKQALKPYQENFPNGCEGAVIKDLLEPYYFRRHRSWLKYKFQHTDDVKIVKCNEGKNACKGMLGSFTCVPLQEHQAIEFEDESLPHFNVSGFTRQQRKEFWHIRKTLNGQVIEVKYSKETRGGKLYGAQYVRRRIDLS